MSSERFEARLIRVAPDFFRKVTPAAEPFDQWGFETSDGWFEPLWHMGYQIQKILNDVPKENRERYRCHQIKQKLGRLCVYFRNAVADPVCQAIKEVIEEAEKECNKTCEICGAPGKVVSPSSWIWVACPTHLERYKAREKQKVWGERLTNKPHTWIVEEIDGGPVGTAECHRCSTCGASGGPTTRFFKRDNILHSERIEEPDFQPFLAGLGSSVKISRDCDEAKRQIDEILASKDWKKRRLAEWQHSGQALIDHVKSIYGVEMKMGKRGILYGGWPDRDGRAFELQPKEFRHSAGWELTITETGEKRELTYYNPAEDFLNEFYSPLVYKPLADKIEARYANVKGFAVTRIAWIHLGVIDGEHHPNVPRYTFCTLIKRTPEGWALQKLRLGLDGKDEHWKAATEEDVFNILDRYLVGCAKI